MKKSQGFTLIELMIVVVIIGILASIAYPSYTQYVVRASREAAQTELMRMAGVQEKIYLNSNSYTINAAPITAAYIGSSAGGLGWLANTQDGKYAFSCVCNANDFAITASPVNGTSQVGDGTLTLNSAGQRLWNNGAKPTW